ncbi:MAG: trigger factor family protein, partial [Coriobacteriaceae bacterium]|nr:trigger factor family protein [Coriobacteriaceae bacterium]
MKVTQKKLEDGKLHLEATATVAEVEQAFNAAQVAFAQQMNLRPQPEKTIDQVAEEVMGIKDLDSVVGAQAAEYLTPFALDKKDIVPAFPPKAVPASALKRGAEYRFTLDVEPKPHYELTSYEKVAFTMPPFGIDEREVENQLAQMADTYAEYRADDPRPVQDGDHVLLSIEAS